MHPSEREVRDTLEELAESVHTLLEHLRQLDAQFEQVASRAHDALDQYVSLKEDPGAWPKN